MTILQALRTAPGGAAALALRNMNLGEEQVQGLLDAMKAQGLDPDEGQPQQAPPKKKKAAPKKKAKRREEGAAEEEGEGLEGAEEEGVPAEEVGRGTTGFVQEGAHACRRLHGPHLTPVC